MNEAMLICLLTILMLVILLWKLMLFNLHIDYSSIVNYLCYRFISFTHLHKPSVRFAYPQVPHGGFRQCIYIWDDRPRQQQLVLAMTFLNHNTIHNHHEFLMAYPVYFNSMKITLCKWLIEFSEGSRTMIILLSETLNSLKNLLR